MIKYRVPATSANIGIGYDCLGMALNLYNYFEIEKSDKFSFEGFIDVSKKDNLFYLAYKKTCAQYKTKLIPLRVCLNANIPVSRGLGSSSAMIVGGIMAYYLINNIPFDKQVMLKIASKIEGHPDNVAPCIYGGLCACNNGVMSNFKVSNKWKLGVLIPNYEVKTSEARKVVKQDIKLKDAVSNVSSALIGVDGLVNYDVDKVKLLNNVNFHEPYRKLLIKDYEICKKKALKQGIKVFLISGSGSSMLLINDKEFTMKIKDIEFKKVKIDYQGAKWLKSY